MYTCLTDGGERRFALKSTWTQSLGPTELRLYNDIRRRSEQIDIARMDMALSAAVVTSWIQQGNPSDHVRPRGATRAQFQYLLGAEFRVSDPNKYHVPKHWLQWDKLRMDEVHAHEDVPVLRNIRHAQVDVSDITSKMIGSTGQAPSSIAVFASLLQGDADTVKLVREVFGNMLHKLNAKQMVRNGEKMAAGNILGVGSSRRRVARELHTRLSLVGFNNNALATAQIKALDAMTKKKKSGYLIAQHLLRRLGKEGGSILDVPEVATHDFK